jgi:hypothetical protein
LQRHEKDRLPDRPACGCYLRERFIGDFPELRRPNLVYNLVWRRKPLIQNLEHFNLIAGTDAFIKTKKDALHSLLHHAVEACEQITRQFVVPVLSPGIFDDGSEAAIAGHCAFDSASGLPLTNEVRARTGQDNQGLDQAFVE